MKLFTSRYQNKQIASTGMVAVGITRGFPRFKLAYQLAKNERALAPTKEGFRLDGPAFESSYRAHLDELGVNKVRELLEKFAEPDKAMVLLCYEPPGEGCHRHIFAAWWEEQTGEKVRELPGPQQKSFF